VKKSSACSHIERSPKERPNQRERGPKAITV